MKLLVTPDIYESFPDLLLGVVALTDVDNRAKPDLARELEEAASDVRSSLGGVNVSEHPSIRCWREAYRVFGAKPKKYPSSIENLVRRTLKGDSPRSINPLVDLYNIVSLKHLVPVGGEDLDCVVGDVRLTRAGDAEPAIQLLGEAERRAPKPGEVIYADDVGAICRRWNWKEADRTKLTERTTRAVLVVETLPPVTRSTLEAALADLGESVREHTGARATTSILDRASREIELS